MFAIHDRPACAHPRSQSNLASKSRIQKKCFLAFDLILQSQQGQRDRTRNRCMQHRVVILLLLKSTVLVPHLSLHSISETKQPRVDFSRDNMKSSYLLASVAYWLSFSSSFTLTAGEYVAGTVHDKPIDLDDDSFQTAIEDTASPLWFLKFYAPWCGHW